MLYYAEAPLTANALTNAPGPSGPGLAMPGADGQSFSLSPQIHTLYAGATGFGKTTAMLHLARPLRRQMDAEGRGCLLFFDPKGDLARALARPGDVIVGCTHHWSLPAEMAEGFGPDASFGEVFERAMELSGQLFAERMKAGASSEQYFPKAARAVLAGLLTVQTLEALADPELDGRLDNARLLDEINRATPQRLLARMAPYPQLESTRYHLYTDGEGRLNNESNGVLSELVLAVREAFVGHWAQHGDFSVRRFLRRRAGQALFLPYDASLGRAQGACCRAVVDIALQTALEPGEKQGDAVFFLEELPLLSRPPLEHLAEAVNLGRGLGLRLVCAVQSVSQLYHLYGRDQADALLGGFGQTLFFRANDAVGAEYIQRRFGHTRRMEYVFNSRGEREAHPREGQAVESWELARLQVGEALVALQGSEAPFRFCFAP